MGYKLEYSKQADKDARLLERTGLDDKAKSLLRILKRDPFKPPYEKLTRDLKGCYSRRINRQHRIVYELLPIVELLGSLPRIELFAREKTDGWDIWGNEVKNDICLEFE